jgi:hypothetical protein
LIVIQLTVAKTNAIYWDSKEWIQSIDLRRKQALNDISQLKAKGTVMKTTCFVAN